jgi:hypothetical protein
LRARVILNCAEGKTNTKVLQQMQLSKPTRIEAAVPAVLDVYLILDNYGTHKTLLIHRRLARHPRFHVHFTATSASWLNLVERWFAALTEKQLRAPAVASNETVLPGAIIR